MARAQRPVDGAELLRAHQADASVMVTPVGSIPEHDAEAAHASMLDTSQTSSSAAAFADGASLQGDAAESSCSSRGRSSLGCVAVHRTSAALSEEESSSFTTCTENSLLGRAHVESIVGQ